MLRMVIFFWNVCLYTTDLFLYSTACLTQVAYFFWVFSTFLVETAKHTIFRPRVTLPQ